MCRSFFRLCGVIGRIPVSANRNAPKLNSGRCILNKAKIEKSALGELRCTASSLETVLLSFLHSRVTSEVTGLLESRTELSVELEQSAPLVEQMSEVLEAWQSGRYMTLLIHIFSGVPDEERLVRGEKLMIVKNCYQFTGDAKGMDYIANGDIAKLVSIRNFEERYGLTFADARLCFPDYDDAEIKAKVCLDTLESEAASLTYEQQNQLYNGVNEDYSHITTKKKRYEAVREDPYFNALQLKYANAITCHKSQGGQWRCVFIDNPFWQDELTVDDLKWLYTALTRAVEKVYLVNFKDGYFKN